MHTNYTGTLQQTFAAYATDAPLMFSREVIHGDLFKDKPVAIGLNETHGELETAMLHEMMHAP